MPYFTAQPQSVSVCSGGSATFTAVAYGVRKTYQWYRNGVLIPGATQSSYTLAGVSVGDHGAKFTVVLGTACGSGKATSSEAILTVTSLGTAITSHPVSVAVTEGSPATFSVTTTGTGLSYQWQRNGVNIAGATGASYTLPAVVGTDQGAQFQVVVSGTCGNVVSNTALLTVLPTANPTATTRSGAKAVRVWHKNGTNSSIKQFLGNFEAGDVVTATVWFKAEPGVRGQMIMGDVCAPDPYDNESATSVMGDGTWKQMTLTHTMTHADCQWLYLYGDRDGSTSDGASVIYDDVVVSSVRRGTVLVEGFENGINPWLDSTQPTDWVNASTAATYNGTKAVRVWNKAGTSSSIYRYLGKFASGDVATVTVRFKTPAGTSASMLLGNSGTANDIRHFVYKEGNGQWQSLTATVTMSRLDDLWLFVYADMWTLTWERATPATNVLYDDLAVSSTQKGLILTEGFENGLVLAASDSDPSGWRKGGAPTDLVANTTNLNLPVIFDFAASPTSLQAGQSSTLGWDVRCPVASTVSLTPGIGTVASSGTRAVSPATDTTYTLTATSAAGSVDRSQAIGVTPVVSNVAVSISPAAVSMAVGATQVFTASVTGTTNTTLSWSVNGTAQAGTGTTFSWTAPAVAGEYRIRATSQADLSKAFEVVVRVSPLVCVP